MTRLTRFIIFGVLVSASGCSTAPLVKYSASADKVVTNVAAKCSQTIDISTFIFEPATLEFIIQPNGSVHGVNYHATAGTPTWSKCLEDGITSASFPPPPAGTYAYSHALDWDAITKANPNIVTLDVMVKQTLVDQAAPLIKKCYETYVAGGGTQTGRIDAVISYGETNDAQIASTAITDPALQECVRHSLLSVKYPPAPPDQSVVIKYPFVLTSP